MRSKNFKGRKCEKMKLAKRDEVVRTFDNIQTAYAQFLDKMKTFKRFSAMFRLKE